MSQTPSNTKPTHLGYVARDEEILTGESRANRLKELRAEYDQTRALWIKEPNRQKLYNSLEAKKPASGCWPIKTAVALASGSVAYALGGSYGSEEDRRISMTQIVLFVDMVDYIWQGTGQTDIALVAEEFRYSEMDIAFLATLNIEARNIALNDEGVPIEDPNVWPWTRSGEGVMVCEFFLPITEYPMMHRLLQANMELFVGSDLREQNRRVLSNMQFDNIGPSKISSLKAEWKDWSLLRKFGSFPTPKHGLFQDLPTDIIWKTSSTANTASVIRRLSNFRSGSRKL